MVELDSTATRAVDTQIGEFQRRMVSELNTAQRDLSAILDLAKQHPSKLTAANVGGKIVNLFTVLAQAQRAAGELAGMLTFEEIIEA